MSDPTSSPRNGWQTTWTRPDLVIVDGSWYLPTQNRNAPR